MLFNLIFSQLLAVFLGYLARLASYLSILRGAISKKNGHRVGYFDLLARYICFSSHEVQRSASIGGLH